MKIVDIHNHLAWDVDDGITNKQDTVTMLNQAKRENIHTIVATPHFMPGRTTMEDIDLINARIDDLKQIGNDFGVDIISGCEFLLNDQYLDFLDCDCLNKIENTDYILVEFDVRKPLGNVEQVEKRLLEVKKRGYKIVLAHVERYFPNGIDLNRVKGFIDIGCVIQINKSSLLGLHGKVIKNNAIKLLEMNYASVIASDAHRLQGRDIHFIDVYKLIVKNYGEKAAYYLLSVNPNHIINNEDIEPIEIKKKSRFSLFK